MKNIFILQNLYSDNLNYHYNASFKTDILKMAA